MKLALKYGIAVTIIIAAWVALKHFVLHIQGPSAQFADLAVFNLSAIVALMMGIKEKRIANGDRLTFLQGLGTGVSIAVMYAILTSLYFALLLLLVGPKLMQQEGDTNMLAAFLGLGIGLTLFGTTFSQLWSLSRVGWSKVLMTSWRSVETLTRVDGSVAPTSSAAAPPVPG